MRKDVRPEPGPTTPPAGSIGRFARLAMATALALSAGTGGAAAVEKLMSEKMACAELQSRLQSAGTLILQRSSSKVHDLPIFNTYVRDERACGQNGYMMPKNVPTADTKSCPVGQCAQLSHPSHKF